MPPPKTKGELGLVETPRTINDEFKPRPVPEVNFTWGPLSIAWNELPGFPWDLNQPKTGAPAQDDIFLTPATAEITYTAAVRVPHGDFIVAYEWDFGDGIKGVGPSVTHTYTAASPSTRAVLCVTDNHGRRFCRGKQINLRPAELTMVNPAIGLD